MARNYNNWKDIFSEIDIHNCTLFQNYKRKNTVHFLRVKACIVQDVRKHFRFDWLHYYLIMKLYSVNLQALSYYSHSISSYLIEMTAHVILLLSNSVDKKRHVDIMPYFWNNEILNGFIVTLLSA